MIRITRVLPVIVLVLLSAVAGAQPGEPPPPPPPPPPPEVQAQYDAAFDAMLRGEFSAAAAGFDAFAASAPDPVQRGAAVQLARLAGQLAARNARLAFAPGPGALPIADGGPPRADGGAPQSEDDTVDGGRATFVVTTTLAALYSGVVALDLLDIDDTRTGTLIVMGATAGGVIGSLYGTRGRTMTAGMADAWSIGMFAGAANALLLSAPLGLYDSSSPSENVNLFTLGTTWGAATAGLLVADHFRPTRAQVSVTSTFGLMGLGSTLLTLALIQPDDLGGNAFVTVTAAGIDVGLGVGAAFAGRLDWSMSRARYVGLSAGLGALAGGGISLLLFADGGDIETAGRAAAGLTLGGLWGGFALGMHLTRDMAPDFRFRVAGGTGTALLTPTRIKDAPGLALVGTF